MVDGDSQGHSCGIASSEIFPLCVICPGRGFFFFACVQQGVLQWW